MKLEERAPSSNRRQSSPADSCGECGIRTNHIGLWIIPTERYLPANADKLGGDAKKYPVLFLEIDAQSNGINFQTCIAAFRRQEMPVGQLCATQDEHIGFDLGASLGGISALSCGFDEGHSPLSG